MCGCKLIVKDRFVLSLLNFIRIVTNIEGDANYVINFNTWVINEEGWEQLRLVVDYNYTNIRV